MPNAADLDPSSSSRAPRSAKEWVVLDELRRHDYDTRNRGSKPDDPGWHVCRCGWEGYWCDWQPHLAQRITEQLDSGGRFGPAPQVPNLRGRGG